MATEQATDGAPVAAGLCPICGVNAAVRGRYACSACRNLKKATAEAERDGGVITLAVMQRVLGQDPKADVGPTERRLREWLERSPKDFAAAMKVREDDTRGAEMERLRARVSELEAVAKVLEPVGPDAGAERAGEVIDGLLAACAVAARGGGGPRPL